MNYFDFEVRTLMVPLIAQDFLSKYNMLSKSNMIIYQYNIT